MSIKNNQIYIGKNSVKALVKRFGSPLYVYESQTIKDRYTELVESIRYTRVDIHYACKANTNLELLKLLRGLGSKIETVSKGEIILARKAGFKPNDIIYTSTSVAREELSFVVKSKVSVNLDSLYQIELYGKLNPGAKIGIRINQGIGAGHHDHVITGGVMSKFGISLSYLNQAKKIASKYNLKIVRLHQHIGSNILDYRILLKAFDKLLETATDFSELESLDFGGGFGVPYFPKEKKLDLSTLGREMTRKMNSFCKKYGKNLSMILEPGRFLVAESGFLLARVTEIKKNPERTFIGVDTGFNHLIRPTMYGSYHQITNGTNVQGKKSKVDIVGNICESGDVFGRNRLIVRPRMGDLFVIHNAGAYGHVMASKYNSRDLPKEILLMK
jgi:diaminopimelate decarboxylase